ncbi:glycine zipper 2TM domain-containing protein [Phenylobacterium sp.]|uniref:glycine zipper 2TM domain-containing protein n=1 Tax=Phenylobacterium sp. TaxID=1871053 RepID=UPI00374DB53E
MRNKLIATAALVCSALAVATAIPTLADARDGHRVRVCRDVSTRGSRNTGTVVGAVTGGLLGNALSHGGGKTGGTIIGAGVGAVAGHQIAKHNDTHRVCHWEYR